MTDSSSSEIELELYEEIVKMNYSTPMASRASSPLSHDKKPIVKCSENVVVSTSTGLVASVTWADLRYPCSLAGKNSSATVAQHLDWNRLRATQRDATPARYMLWPCLSVCPSICLLQVAIARFLAIAEGSRDALCHCQLKSSQLLHNCTKTSIWKQLQ